VGEKLDRFLPSLETTTSIKRQLINAGIDPDAIPEDWLVAIVAAMTKWQCQTQDGLKFVVNMLGFQWRKGLDDHVYEYDDHNTGVTHRIPPDKIYFFAGAAVAGNPVNPADITVSKPEHLQCEGCGISAHCVKEVWDASRGRSERLCNTCAVMSENPVVKQGGCPKKCDDCTKVCCYHHPKNMKRLRPA
jgi:hypothetical protein